MIELSNEKLMVVNGEADPGIIDILNPKNIYNSSKNFFQDVKKIVNGNDKEINDFGKGFAKGVKSAFGF